MTWLTGGALIGVLYTILLVCALVGGSVVFLPQLAKTQQQMQDRVRNALHDENELLHARIKRLETDNQHLLRMMALVVAAIKKTHGITLKIDDDVVVLFDASGKAHVSRLPDESAGDT